MCAKEIYILVPRNGDNEPMVYVLPGPNGEKLPFVALDDDGLDRLRQHAQAVSNKCGHPVDIISFTAPSVYETVRPLENSTGD